MLIDYIEAAMRRAKYEMLADEGFVGTIPGFRGLIGHARSLERCRDDLYGALQAWLLLKLQHGDRDLPVVDGMKPRASARGY
jgi:predicted RNase H-like HicB family nuclease